ncbi:APC family permease [Saccharopolyspora phatthalungensis]|uniref:Amino acid transporter n=1 Tax=Saccharopolyspora phatthalungensis TaxID=664693 RepID=A0A840Q4J2_9PSEU|nr:APC family permease [Saccharopolyspora phatthalungensis]MBB5153658.1 amino acid transporter [Saccharopolyspora phatthalungensis]
MSRSLEPSSTTTATSDQHELLNRGLGVFSVVLMVVAAAAPLGTVAGLLPVMTSASQNVGAPLFFLIAAVLLILFAVGFTAMSRHVPNAGAFYSYIQAGLGRHLGTAAAALAVGSYLVLLIGVNAYAGVAVSNVIATYTSVHLPWWLLAFASLGVTGALGYRDIELSSKVLGLLLVCESLIIVVVAVAIGIRGGAHGMSSEPFSTSQLTTGKPSLGLMFAIFSFIGFEATAVFRHEARDPDRTIPRATYISVLFIGLFYGIASWFMIVGVGTDKAVALAGTSPENFTLDLGQVYVATAARDIMQLLLATSLFAVVLAFHNVVTRYQFTLAERGLLPAKLAEVHPTHRAPSRSSLVVSAVSVIATVLTLGLDPIAETYTWLSGASTLGLIALMTLTSLAVVRFFRNNPARPGTWRAVVAPALSFLGLAAVLALVIANFPLLVGGTANAIVIGGIIALAFVAGLLGAEYLRRRRPSRFAELTTLSTEA